MSSWRSARFGATSADLAEIVPVAIWAAHEDALAAHAASHMQAHDAYGNTMKVRAPELLIEQLSGLDGVAVDPSDDGGRFPLAVVAETSVALLPMRVGRDSALGHEALRLRTPVSEVRRALLAKSSEYAMQLALDTNSVDGFSWYDIRGRKFERVVVVAYGSSPEDGVWDLGWGDLELVNSSRGEVTWHYWEALERNQRAPQDSVSSSDDDDDSEEDW